MLCYVFSLNLQLSFRLQRALSLVRFHAEEWGINPHKIGVLGFSAGGHLVAATSTQFAKRVYSVVDAADKESCRPDFAVSIYPGHLSLEAAEWDAKKGNGKYQIPYEENPIITNKRFAINPDLHITSETSPTFLLQAENDHVDDVGDSIAYYIALEKAGVPVEMHLYAQGGHGFGLRNTEFPITKWPELVEKWLHTIGMVTLVHDQTWQSNVSK